MVMSPSDVSTSTDMFCARADVAVADGKSRVATALASFRANANDLPLP
jgi:hypothetical protein